MVRFPIGRLLGTVLFALAIVSAGPASAAWWLRVLPAAVTGGSGPGGAAIQTITPDSAWVGSYRTTAPNPLRDSSQVGVLPFGTQTISAVASVGGIPQATVGSTANIYDAEWWVVANTGGGLDGLWQVQVVDGTHVNLCHRLTASVGGYSCSIGAAAFSFGSMTPGGTLRFPFPAIGVPDAVPYDIIEAGDGQVVCVPAKTVSRAGINYVAATLQGNTVTATQQSIGPTRNWTKGSPGTQGYCFKVDNPANGTTGEAVLDLDIVPVNGFDRVISVPLTLNVPGTMARTSYYVDPIAGVDTTSRDGSNATTQAWNSIQYCLAKATANGGGNFCNVVAPTEVVTIATGSHTIVTWNSANNKLIPGATVTFSGGSLPAGMVAGRMYYVANRSFIAGQQFEITGCDPSDATLTGQSCPAGDANQVPLVPNAVLQDWPLVTSGTASGVSVTGVVALDPTTKPTASNLNSRSNIVQPAAPHTATMSRQYRFMSANGSHTWDPREARTILRDMTIDMGMIGNFQVNASLTSSSAPSQIHINQSRMNDAGGTIPPWSYSGTTGTGTGLAAPSINQGFVLSGNTENTAITETSAVGQAPTNSVLISRNMDLKFSWDALDFGGQFNIGSFNSTILKKGLYLTWLWQEVAGNPSAPHSQPYAISAVSAPYTASQTTQTLLTSGSCSLTPQNAYYGSIAYSGPARDITFASLTGSDYPWFECNVTDSRFIDYSGSTPKMYYVVAIDETNRKLTIAADSSASIAAGDPFVAGIDAHSDFIQMTRNDCNLTTGGGYRSSNWFFQKMAGSSRFTNYSNPFTNAVTSSSNNGAYTGDNIQGMLSQAGLCSANMTVTYDGARSLTTSTDIYVRPGTILRLGTAKTFVMVARTQPAGLAGNSSSIKLEYPARNYDGSAAATSYTSIGRINSADDLAIVNSGWWVGANFDSNAWKFEEGQVNWAMQYVTFRGGPISYRNDTTNFAGINMAALDSLLSGVSSNSSVSPYGSIGTTADNSQAFINTMGVSTNSLDSPDTMLFGPLDTSNIADGITVTGGTLKTIGSRVPIGDPWDYNNVPRTPSCHVGMLC